MTIPLITHLPPSPKRSDPMDVFQQVADTHLAALPPMVDQLNLAIEGINQGLDGFDANVALAESSAAAAFAAAGQTATSTTTLTTGKGTKSLTLAQTGKLFSVGQTVNISDSNATNVMSGYVTAFTSGTGALTVDVQVAKGSASVSSWIVSVGAPVSSDNQAVLRHPDIMRMQRRARDI